MSLVVFAIARTTTIFLPDSEGAAIVVIGQLISAGFTEQLYNPQCFLQYEDPRIPPPSWEVRGCM